MRFRFGSRPSALLTLLVVGFALAIGGTALAGSQSLKAKLTKAKVKSIAKKQIAKAAPGLTVAGADSPSARALIIDSPLTVTQARNIEQSQLDNPRIGVYCFDLAFTPVGAQATNETQSQVDIAVMSAVLDPLSRARPRDANERGSAFNGCDPGTDLQITAIDPTTGLQVNTSFFVEAWR